MKDSKSSSKSCQEIEKKKILFQNGLKHTENDIRSCVHTFVPVQRSELSSRKDSSRLHVDTRSVLFAQIKFYIRFPFVSLPCRQRLNFCFHRSWIHQPLRSFPRGRSQMSFSTSKHRKSHDQPDVPRCRPLCLSES